MPVLEVEVVLRPGESLPADLAARLATTAARVLEAPAGSTWVRLRSLPPDQYAENEAPETPPVYPVFVNLLLARWSPG